MKGRRQPSQKSPKTQQLRAAAKNLSSTHVPRAMGAVAEMLQTSIRQRPPSEQHKASSQRKDRIDPAIDEIPIIDISAKNKPTEPGVRQYPLPRKRDEATSDDDSLAQRKILPSISSSISFATKTKKKRDQRTEASESLPPKEKKATISGSYSYPSNVKGISESMGDSGTRNSQSRSGARQRKDALRVHLPGLIRQLSGSKGKRVSKALPDTPKPSPSPYRLSFAPRPVSKDVDAILFLNKDKHLQVDGAPALPENPLVAPRMGYDASLGNYTASGTSSGSSYDSAGQTWKMIESLKKAPNKEAVVRCQESFSIQNRSEQDFESFSKNRSPLNRVEKLQGWSTVSLHPDTDSEGRPKSSTLSKAINEKETCAFDDLKFIISPNKRTRSRADTITRRASSSSLYSIVIKPTRSVSDEAPEALVLMKDMPRNIKRVLHESLERDREEVEATIRALISNKHEYPTPKKVVSRSNSMESLISQDEDYQGEYYHSDLTMAIEALRSATAGIDDEEINFGIDNY